MEKIWEKIGIQFQSKKNITKLNKKSEMNEFANSKTLGIDA